MADPAMMPRSKLRLEYLRGIYSETSSDSDFAPYFVQRRSYYCRVLGGRGPGPFSNYSPSKCAPCEQRLPPICNYSISDVWRILEEGCACQ